MQGRASAFGEVRLEAADGGHRLWSISRLSARGRKCDCFHRSLSPCALRGELAQALEELGPIDPLA
jgi:hypothetical protein